MANLIIPVGIPGSGKSTWAKTMLDGKYHIVSSDEIRKRLFGSLKVAHMDDEATDLKLKRQEVWDSFYQEVEEFLKHNVDVVADATNLRAFARERLSEIAKTTNAKAHTVIFDIDPEEAFRRNRERDEDEVVPDDVMLAFVLQYEAACDLILSDHESYDSITKIETIALNGKP